MIRRAPSHRPRGGRRRAEDWSSSSSIPPWASSSRRTFFPAQRAHATAFAIPLAIQCLKQARLPPRSFFFDGHASSGGDDSSRIACLHGKLSIATLLSQSQKHHQDAGWNQWMAIAATATDAVVGSGAGEDQREEEVVPGVEEAQDRGRGDAGATIGITISRKPASAAPSIQRRLLQRGGPRRRTAASARPRATS